MLSGDSNLYLLRGQPFLCLAGAKQTVSRHCNCAQKGWINPGCQPSSGAWGKRDLAVSDKSGTAGKAKSQGTREMGPCSWLGSQKPAAPGQGWSTQKPGKGESLRTWVWRRKTAQHSQQTAAPKANLCPASGCRAEGRISGFYPEHITALLPSRAERRRLLMP